MTSFSSSSVPRPSAARPASPTVGNTPSVVVRTWTRRNWLTVTSTSSLAAVLPAWRINSRGTPRASADLRARVAAQAEFLDVGPAQAIVQQAVDVARSAGAQYADAKMTRVVQHHYQVGGPFYYGTTGTNDLRDYDPLEFRLGALAADIELVGLGVRVLCNGAWGFAAFPLWSGRSVDADTVARLARDAVSQAKMNAVGSAMTVELGTVPTVTGSWTTPVKIDPFSVPIEEKMDAVAAFHMYANEVGLGVDGIGSELNFVRQERIVATSEGSLMTQICYESGGSLQCLDRLSYGNGSIRIPVPDIDASAQGWERIIDGHIPEKMQAIRDWFDRAHPQHSATVGRYTLICDGATMASILAETIGVATQLDRAFGYEANAGGTSFFDDPLAMVGHFLISVPGVTVTANRSTPAQLATVKWDDEGVQPAEATLVKDGVLMDFQTTREQAAWLAPYYQQHGRPVQSHGYASSQDGLHETMQLMPNLALAPNPTNVSIADLVQEVKNGILIEGARASNMDAQARNGLLVGGRQSIIKEGKIVAALNGGTVSLNSLNFWKNLMRVGGASTGATMPFSQYQGRTWRYKYQMGGILQGYFPESNSEVKGQPKQHMGYSVRAVAATIANQPYIVTTRRA